MGLGESQRPFFKVYFQCHFFHKEFSDFHQGWVFLWVDILGAFSASFCLRVPLHCSLSHLMNYVLPEGGADLASPLCLLLHLVQKALSRSWAELERLELKAWERKQAGFRSLLCFQELEIRPRGHPGGGTGSVSWCVEAAVLVEGMTVKPCQGIFKPMSSQNSQCRWAQLCSEEEGDSVGPSANIWPQSAEGREGKGLENETSSRHQENMSEFWVASCMPEDCDFIL